MGLDSNGCEAVAESVVFLRYFADLPDPRQRAKVMYPLSEVLLLCLLAVLAGAETITDIARFPESKPIDEAAVARVFAIMAEFGGAELVGSAKKLPKGVFAPLDH